MQSELFISKNKSFSVKNALFTVFICLITAIAVLRIVFNVVYVKVYVVGYSMETTLRGAPDKYSGGGDYVYAFKGRHPRRGDIVVVDTKGEVKAGDKLIIKRVIALGGDSVELKNGVLYLNGSAVDEPYVRAENNTPSQNNYDMVVVPDGCMFCMGDNRNVSIDSRSDKYGCMRLDSIIGIVADWSMTFKDALSAVNNFFDFTVPEAFGYKK